MTEGGYLIPSNLSRMSNFNEKNKPQVVDADVSWCHGDRLFCDQGSVADKPSRTFMTVLILNGVGFLSNMDSIKTDIFLTSFSKNSIIHWLPGVADGSAGQLVRCSWMQLPSWDQH